MRAALLAIALVAAGRTVVAGPASAAPAAGAAAQAVAAAVPAVADSASAGALRPSAVATASKTEVSVGETFIVEVRASGPAGTEFAFPDAAAQDTFELSAAPPPPTPLPPGTHRYRAAAFALGETQVPAIPVRYRLPGGATGEVSTAPIPLRIVSLLPKDKAEQRLADVRAPVSLAVGRAFWIGLVAALLLAGALAWWLLSRRRKEAPVEVAPTPAIAPDEEARRALDALAASGLLARGEHRLFYIELTAIAKRYLERRLGAPIVEMTTAEMLAHLKSVPDGAELTPALRDLSGAADRIKFARADGLNQEAERHLSATRALIAALEARLRPAAPAGLAA
ncbi:MAG TPA: hypothetical protein VGK89_00440 [Candidatus Eisenbacteria bacterium]|jgi:hypothetical protein